MLKTSDILSAFGLLRTAGVLGGPDPAQPGGPEATRLLANVWLSCLSEAIPDGLRLQGAILAWLATPRVPGAFSRWPTPGELLGVPAREWVQCLQRQDTLPDFPRDALRDVENAEGLQWIDAAEDAFAAALPLPTPTPAVEAVLRQHASPALRALLPAPRPPALTATAPTPMADADFADDSVETLPPAGVYGCESDYLLANNPALVEAMKAYRASGGKARAEDAVAAAISTYNRLDGPAIHRRVTRGRLPIVEDETEETGEKPVGTRVHSTEAQARNPAADAGTDPEGSGVNGPCSLVGASSSSTPAAANGPAVRCTVPGRALTYRGHLLREDGDRCLVRLATGEELLLPRAAVHVEADPAPEAPPAQPLRAGIHQALAAMRPA